MRNLYIGWGCLFCYLKSYNMQHVLSAPLSWNSVFLKLHMEPDFSEKVSFWGKSPKISPNGIFWFLPKIYFIDIFLLWCSMVFLLCCKNRIPENNTLTFSKKSGSMCNVLWFAIYCPIHSQPTRLFDSFPAGIYLLKVNNRNTRTRCEICSKLTIKIPERRLWYR